VSLTVRQLSCVLIMLALPWAVPVEAQRIQFPTTISPPATGTAGGTQNALLPTDSSTYQSPAATYPPSSTFSSPNSSYQPLKAYAQQTPSYPQPAQGYQQPAQGFTQSAPGYGQSPPGYVQQTPGYSQPAQGYGQAAAPVYGQQAPVNAQAAPVYAQQAPGYAQPGAYNYTPPTAPPLLPPPGGTAAPAITGAGAQPPAAWDPYATPCPNATPSPLLSQDPYFQYGQPAAPAMAMTKALQELRLDYHWFAGHGVKELGINDAEISAKFAIPFLYNSETPLLITPGFAVHYWEGPVSVIPGPPPPADLPARTYDAYLDAAWKPQILPWLGGELSARIGLYDDFRRKVTTDTFRFTGTGLGVVSVSPNVKVKAGVMYLDRNFIKLLPSGGIVWTPNQDVYFNILFPNPKIAKRLINSGNTEWWGYVSGDYGGGAWHITRDSAAAPAIAGNYDDFDYNDIRVAVGLEFKTYRNFSGLFEVGGAFSRELRYRSDLPKTYFPSNTVFLRGGLAY
jgi:hypothetical protein